MKILNLYAGIGGNRKLWGDEHEITAVEYREDIANVYRHYFPGDTVVVGDAHQYLLDHYPEYDFIWSSPPCQTHSRLRLFGWKNDNRVAKKYPDMKLYQEIIFLQNYFNGQWVVENVTPYYEPLILPTIKLGRHLFWSSFTILKTEVVNSDINRGSAKEWINLHGFDLSNFKINSRKDQIYRNCVHPSTGRHILDCATNSLQKYEQGTLFDNINYQP
ncbi:DNA cytosine methyltransferase [Petrimonas sulfuriphila]|uniref:DNA cytosine methyltransferase n=1 Tax=Petrimonas sulfuriphila TaxID=285070 RepID=UPI003EBBBA21